MDVDGDGSLPERIRLLVCTANLGNALPDDESIDAWIPRDGICSEVIQPNPRYPLMMMSPEHEADERGIISIPPQVLQSVEENLEDSSTTSSEGSSSPKLQTTPSPSSRTPHCSRNGMISAEKRKKVCRCLADWAKGLTAKITATDPKCENDEHSEEIGLCNVHVDEMDRFEIIVIGMQEASFDTLSASPERTGPGNVVESEPEGNDFEGEKSAVCSPAFPIRKGAQFVQHTVGKGLQKIARLTQDRDYTKQVPAGKLNTQRHDWGGGTVALHSQLDAQLPSYKRVVSYQRGQMRLEVYSNSNSVDVKVLHVAACNTGRAGLANKGGIVCELLINGSTRMSFMSTHLEAHEGQSKFKARCSSLSEILNGTKNSKWLDVSQTSHFAFTLGDLNFRTVLDHSLHKDAHRRIIQNMVERKNWFGLNRIDELNMALEERRCLAGYKTPMCNFPPTFKTVRKPGFEWQEQRRPSYCDRILWKTAKSLENGITPLVYEPVPGFSTSDHKPVRAAFTVGLNCPFRAEPCKSHSVAAAFARLKRSLSLVNHKEADRNRASVHRTRENDQTERVELFLSTISVDVFNKEGIPPSPYVAVLAYPEEALHSRKRDHFFRLQKHKPKSGMNALPSTSKKFSTFSPTWSGEEEIKCKIVLHHNDGTPVDFTGAMLHILVLDFNPATGDSLVGAIDLNLTSILKNCRDRAAGMLEKQNLSSSFSRGNHRRSFGKNVVSKLTRSKKIQEIDAMTSSAFEEEDPIVSIEIDEVLVKNGREVGRISCTLEAWWINSATAQILGSKSFYSRKDPFSTKNAFSLRRKPSQITRRRSLMPLPYH